MKQLIHFLLVPAENILSISAELLTKSQICVYADPVNAAVKAQGVD